MPEDLPSWRDGPTKQAIIDFVARTCGGDGSAAVPVGGTGRGVRQRRHLVVREADADPAGLHPPPARRDGGGAAGAARAASRGRPSSERDHGWFGALMDRALRGRRHQREDAGARHPHRLRRDQRRGLRGVSGRLPARHPASHARSRATWSAPTPRWSSCSTICTANGFTNYIVSGGGRDFMRPISQDMYGIPRERVIGSSSTFAYTSNGRAAPSPTSPRPTTSTTARRSRSGSGTGSAGAPARRPGTPTATCHARIHPPPRQAGAAAARPSRRRRAGVRLHQGAEHALGKPTPTAGRS